MKLQDPCIVTNRSDLLTVALDTFKGIGEAVQARAFLLAVGSGAGVLLLTAGNVYLTLQRGSERLWDGVIAPQQRDLPFKRQAVQFIRIRLEAFFVVILIGLLVVLDQLSANLRMIPADALYDLSQAIPWLGGFLSYIPVLQFGRLMVPFFGFSVTALSLQFLLPSRRVPFKPLIPGSERKVKTTP